MGLKRESLALSQEEKEIASAKVEEVDVADADEAATVPAPPMPVGPSRPGLRAFRRRRRG